MEILNVHYLVKDIDTACECHTGSMVSEHWIYFFYTLCVYVIFLLKEYMKTKIENLHFLSSGPY